jgi:hypothetical protein
MSKIEEPWKAKLPGGTRADTAQEEPAPRTGRDEIVGYFGYGSLVNRATLRTEILAAIPARLNGWRRTWRPRPLMDADTMAETALAGAGSVVPSLLSAHRAEEASIDGVLIIDLAVNLPVIDTREFRYHRRDITLAELSLDIERAERETGLRLDAATRLHVYEARTEHPGADGPSPILRSYLDAVMQGFLHAFGEEGVHRFVAETEAFHLPIHEDRHEPLYPRAVSLTATETELFDLALGRRGHGPEG